MSDKFWEAFKESYIISGLMALVLTGTACYLWIAGNNVPQELYSLLFAVVGFYFGGKVQALLARG